MDRLFYPKGCSHTDAPPAGFGFWDKIPLDTAQCAFYTDKIGITNTLNMSPYEFVIEACSDSFLCMNSINMDLKIKVTDQRGRPIKARENIAPVNNIFHSMWESIEVKINDDVISPESTVFIPYKAILETAMSHTQNQTKQTLQAQGWCMDTAGKYADGRAGAAGENVGFKTRQKWIDSSKEMHFNGPLCADFLRSDNHLAPNNKLTITLRRASDSFALVGSATGDDFKIVITDLALHVRRVRLAPRIHNTLMSPSGLERYQTSCTKIKMFQVPKGVRQISEPLITGGIIPKHITIATVASEGALGKMKNNPFYFQHFNVRKLNLRLNSRSIPRNPLRPDFPNQLIAREYSRLFTETGRECMTKPCLISPYDFASGFTIFPFDLTPDKCNGEHTHIGRVGDLDLEMEWNVALPKCITVLVYTAHDQVTTINRADGTTNTEFF